MKNKENVSEVPFEKRFPFKLNPTNIPGVFARESLPEDLDVNNAGPRTLLKYGIFARKPKANDNPVLVKTWEKMFSKRIKFFTPVLERKVRKMPKRHTTKQIDGSVYDTNWSGAVLQGNWFSALAIWNVPTVSQSNQPVGTAGYWDSSSWVGLGDNYLLQAGIQQTVDQKGNANYVPWYEWYAPSPADDPGYYYQTNIANMAINAGDEIFCSIHYVIDKNGNISYGLFNLVNRTSNVGVSLSLNPPIGFTLTDATNTCAEWIVEAPGYGSDGTIQVLANFTPVVFTGAFCCGDKCILGNPLNADIWTVPNPPPEITAVAVADFKVTITYIG